MPGYVHQELWSRSDREDAIERLERDRWSYLREHRGPARVADAVTAIVAQPGGGKGLTTTWRARKLYTMGINIVTTQSAGLLFGKVVPPDDATDLYNMSAAFPNSHLIVDESQSWFNKWDQGTARGQNAAEAVVGRRKAGLSLEVTMQQDRMAPQFLRFEADGVEFPMRITHRKVALENGDSQLVAIPGEHAFAKVGAYRAYGRGVMAFRDGPGLLDFVLRRRVSEPSVRWFVYPYEELLEASKLYYTMEPMDVGARHLVDPKSVVDDAKAKAAERAESRMKRQGRS